MEANVSGNVREAMSNANNKNTVEDASFAEFGVMPELRSLL